MFPIGETIAFWRATPGLIKALADVNSSKGVGIGEKAIEGEGINSKGRLLAAGVSSILSCIGSGDES
jgi:hypothetical protein